MTIGYDQPTVQYPVPFNSEVTQSTVLLSAAGWAIDYLVGKTNFASQLGPSTARTSCNSTSEERLARSMASR